MKAPTLTIALLLGLALISNGCASVAPQTPQQEVSQQQTAQNNGNEDGYDWFWDNLYEALVAVGQSISSK
jgi:hypothetical protein